jgi:cell wall-associated NlpC family hydrolase
VVTNEQFVDLLLAQKGDTYVLGAEALPSDENPTSFDCSELIEWAANRLGVDPKMPDGASVQLRHADKHGLRIDDIELAIATRGALLHKYPKDADPLKKSPKTGHVAVSLGNGRTIEARSEALGIGEFSALKRDWTHACLVPGIHYVEQPPGWRAPGDPVHTLEDAKACIQFQGETVVTIAELDKADLDIRIVVGRFVNELMKIDIRKANK